MNEREVESMNDTDMSDGQTFCKPNPLPSSMSGGCLVSVWLVEGLRESNWKSTRESSLNWLSSWIAVSWQLQKSSHLSQVSMISEGCKYYEILTFILTGIALQAALVLVLAPLFGKYSSRSTIFNKLPNFIISIRFSVQLFWLSTLST